MEELPLVREASLQQHALRRCVARTGHRDDRSEVQVVASKGKAGGRDFCCEASTPKCRVERISDVHLVYVLYLEVPKHGAADRLPAAHGSEDPEPEAVVGPVLQVAGDVGSGSILIADAAELRHHGGVAMHAPQFGEVLGREALRLKPGRREGVRKRQATLGGRCD